MLRLFPHNKQYTIIIQMSAPQSVVVWYTHEEFSCWPARIVDVVFCLRRGQPLLLYQLRFFGAGLANTPPDSALFAEEFSIVPFSEPATPPANRDLRRAIGLAKRYTHFPAKTFETQMDVETDVLSDAGVESTSIVPEALPETGEDNFRVTWEDRKAVVNRLYRHLKAGCVEKSEAQDRAMVMEQEILNSSSTVSGYWEMVSDRTRKLRGERSITMNDSSVPKDRKQLTIHPLTSADIGLLLLI